MENSKSNSLTSEPLLIVISGFAGSGKDAVVERLRTQNPTMHFVVTATTRPMRPGEKNGIDYYFLSEEEFKSKVQAGDFIEYAQVYKYLKGVLKAEAAQQMRTAFANGRDVIMRLDVQGAATIRMLYPEALSIFIWASEDEVVERMRKRDPNGQLPDDFDERLQKINAEAACMPDFDYVIHNRDEHFEDTMRIMQSIVEAEHHRTHPRKIQL